MRETLEQLQSLRLPRQCPLETFTARTGPLQRNVEVVVSCVLQEAVVRAGAFLKKPSALADGVVTVVLSLEVRMLCLPWWMIVGVVALQALITAMMALLTWRIWTMWRALRPLEPSDDY